jgi:hypothetical protein
MLPATATLCQNLAVRKVDVALVLESWLYKGKISGLNHERGKVYSVAHDNNARSFIYIRNHINALPLLEFCSRNATMVRIKYTYRGGCEELIVASAYLPYASDKPPPSKEMREIIDYSQSRKNN